MPFSTTPEKEIIIYMAYTCIIQDILDIDNTFNISAQEVKICFSKLLDMVIKSNDKLIIEKVKLKHNNEREKLNYV